MGDLENYIENRLEMYCFLKNPEPEVPYVPANVYVEPTNVCDLRCIICARAKMKRKIGFLKLSEFEKIIDKFVSSNWYPPITITGNGEPLLHKDLFSMIKYAKMKGFLVSLISNSTLLSKDKIGFLLQSGLNRYQTMFDSIDKESFEKIRVRADYEKTKANIIDLIERNEEVGHPVFISIGLVKTSRTKKIKETKDLWESYPIDNFYLSPLLSLVTDSGLYSEAMEITKNNRKGICSDPFTDMSISWNGDAKLCPPDFNDRWVIGNIFKNEIVEIWNGERAQKMRRALIDDDIDFFASSGLRCDKCNTPYIEEYTTVGHRESIPSRITREVRSFYLQKQRDI